MKKLTIVIFAVCLVLSVISSLKNANALADQSSRGQCYSVQLTSEMFHACLIAVDRWSVDVKQDMAWYVKSSPEACDPESYIIRIGDQGDSYVAFFQLSPLRGQRITEGPPGYRIGKKSLNIIERISAFGNYNNPDHDLSVRSVLACKVAYDDLAQTLAKKGTIYKAEDFAILITPYELGYGIVFTVGQRGDSKGRQEDISYAISGKDFSITDQHWSF